MSPSEKDAETDLDQQKSGEGFEKALLDEQLAFEPSSASYKTLFRYATALDVALYFSSIIACMVGGIGTPMMMMTVGNLTGSFSTFLSGSLSEYDFDQAVNHQVLYFVYFGAGQLVAVTVGIFGLNLFGERVTKRIRQAFLKAVLRQNIAFFDKHGAGEIADCISTDMSLIRDGLSQKVGLIGYGVAGFFAALIIGFVHYWRLALVLLCLPFVIIMAMGGLGKAMKQFQAKANAGYAQSGSFAEEVISCIRNVTAFGSQSRLGRKYDETLVSPARDDFKGKMTMAALMSFMMFIINASYGLSFWQGNRFLISSGGSISDVITTLFTGSMGGVVLGHAAPHIAAIAQASAAASRLFAIIDRKSPIDPQLDTGDKLETVQGAIEFKGVTFNYPSRPDQTILKDFDLSIPAGKTIALVGPSGSGKSTLFSLIERLYPALQGHVTLDGHPIESLNTKWLRSQFGLVAQDNFLFNTSVFENIAYGLGEDYEKLNPETVKSLVQKAAATANAHSFIMELPNGYQTSVGQRGSRLSGGQRQRIAIARAIISEPKILLLDEATAALDTKSERAVQEALFSAAKGRTTIIIAHRLSTVQGADVIAVLEHGRVTEIGTHEKLLAADSTYASLVRAQQLRNAEEKESADAPIVHMKTASTMIDEAYSAEDGASPKTTKRDSSFLELAALVWSINQPEHLHLVVGILCAVIAGTGYPVMGIFFGNSVVSLTLPEFSTGGHSLNFWAAMYLMLGLVLATIYFIQGYCFAIAGSALGQRGRSLAFKTILRQDMAFFDKEDFSSGSLAAFLSSQATKLAGISGTTLGSIMNSLVTLASAIAISCSFGWKLGLVATSMMPIMMTSGFLRLWVVGFTERRFKALTKSTGIASEAVSAIRTVATLTAEPTINQRYTECLEQEQKQSLGLDFLSALLYALSQSLSLFINGLLFWYGGTRLIATGEYTIQQFFVCYITVVFSSQAAGTVFSYAPEIAGAQDAAAKLKRILESVPSIDAQATTGEQAGNIAGDVALQQVDFAYPSAQQHRVLQDVDMNAHHGQFVALVGGSGSGKSTVLNLLERLYDPSSGTVLADQRDIRDFNIASLRSQMALVEQEAPLIGGSIRECLISDDDTLSNEALEEACRTANIHDFIISLPEGYDTSVGARGDRLSGGQKQRIAIAKALLRKPKILLLDEATSALDSESERLVKDALELASQGRTTIAVAHRLSSIAHANKIFVFDHGRIAESGTHDELMAKRGKYFELVSLQNMGQ